MLIVQLPSMEKMIIIQFHGRKICFSYFNKNFAIKNMAKGLFLHSRMTQKMLNILFHSMKKYICILLFF